MSLEAEKRGNYRLWSNMSCYGIVLPAVLILLVFIYLPVFWAFSKSMYEFEIGGESKFVGLSNYAEFLTGDPVTWKSLANMLLLTLFYVVVRLTFPLVVAKFIISLPREKWRYLYRIVFLIPMVVPGVAVQLIWGSMIYADAGLLNEALRGLGLHGLTTGWLTNPATALVCVALVGFPFIGGFEVLIYYAGLSAIPDSVNEAALLEGCVGIRKFFKIDIPMVMSQLKLILILTIIGGIQGFEGILILTQGMPGFETMVPGYWMYLNAFSFQRMGYACAIGVMLFVLIFGMTFLNFKYFRSSEELQAQK